MSERKKPGRPRGKPLSPVERAQRRVAALRHGRRASSALRQTVPACKRETCPLSFPCEVRRRAIDAGFGLEVCVVALMADDHIRETLLAALRKGDTEGLEELTAGSMAGLFRLHGRTLDELNADGFAVSRPGRDGGGGCTEAPTTHPSAFPFLELNKQLGLTADQQALTPKSRGETRRNTTEADHMEWMRRMSGLTKESKA